MAGSKDADHIALQQLSAVLVADAGWKLKRATVGGGDVRWVDSLGDATNAQHDNTLPRRLAQAIAAIRPNSKDATPAEPLEDETSGGLFSRVTSDLLVDLGRRCLSKALQPSGAVERLDLPSRED